MTEKQIPKTEPVNILEIYRLFGGDKKDFNYKGEENPDDSLPGFETYSATKETEEGSIQCEIQEHYHPDFIVGSLIISGKDYEINFDKNLEIKIKTDSMSGMKKVIEALNHLTKEKE